MLQLDLCSPAAYAAVAVVLALGCAIRWAALPKPLPGIPYNKSSATSILGDALAMVKHKWKSGTIFDWMASQGVELNSPVCQLFLKPLSKPAVIVIDPRETQDVLLRRAKDFDRSQFFQDGFSGTVPNHHIVQPTNDKFRAGRRLLADTMTTGFLHGVAAPHLHKHALRVMQLWGIKNQASAGHAFFAADDVSHFTLDSIWEVSFGSELNTIPDEIGFLEAVSQIELPRSKDDAITLPRPEYNVAVKSMLTITHGLDVALTSPAPRQVHWFLRKTPGYRHASAYRSQLVQERLDDAKMRMLMSRATATTATTTTITGAGGDEFSGVTCATDHMVRREAQAAAKEDRRPHYDSREAKDELFGFLIAGHDTTATTLSWALKFIADHPRVQSKLRNIFYHEAYPSFAGTNTVPSAEAMVTTQVPYLDAVIEEIVRCGLTAPVAVRMATHDTELLGYRIPKGTDVYFLTCGPGFVQPNTLEKMIPEEKRSLSCRENKDRALPSWNPEDIGQFNPERWLKGNEKGDQVFDKHAGPVVQFGGGLRGCFGKKLAYLEMRFFITILVWNYELLQVPPKLRGYEAVDLLTHKPQKCYVLLKETGKNM